MKRWATISKYQSLERPEIKGLFVDGICVANYFGYKSIYIVNLYCFKSARIHNSMMVDTIANCKRIAGDNYLRDITEDENCIHDHEDSQEINLGN